MENGENILAYDENITPEQKALLRGHNFREYPSIQELISEGKGTNNISNNQEKREKMLLSLNILLKTLYKKERSYGMDDYDYEWFVEETKRFITKPLSNNC